MQIDKQKLKHYTFWGIICFSICLVISLIVLYVVKSHQDYLQSLQVPEVITFYSAEGDLGTRLQPSLEEHGLTKEEAYKIVNKLDTVLNMRRVSKYDKYKLTFDENHAFKMLVVTKDFSRYYVAQVDGELVAGILDISVKTRRRKASGTINPVLFTSMQEQGVKSSLILDFADVFSWNIDFNTETRVGDKFSLIWEEEYTVDGKTLNEQILAAYYEGEVNGKNYSIRFEDEFYDENGKFTKKMFLKSPISMRGFRITSRFTTSRLHPILRYRRPHLGIDYAAPLGTPIETVADGVIRFMGRKGGFGNYMEVAHPNNYTTCYGHLRGFAKGMRVGTKVKQGQTIAYLGSTGLSTGPHLDFRIRQGTKYFDFLSSKHRSSATREIPKDKREEFNKIKEDYLKELESKE